MTGLFQWLSRIFGSGDGRPISADASYFPLRTSHDSNEDISSGVRHDPQLIPRLKNDHRALLKQYATIKTAATENRWVDVHDDLLRFRAELTDHLLTESVKLYVYLRLKLAADQVQLRLMRNFSSEMVGIGKVVVDFIETNEDIALSPDKQAQFMTGWSEIGKVLGDRVGREEKTLYPMYEEPIESGKSSSGQTPQNAHSVNK